MKQTIGIRFSKYGQVLACICEAEDDAPLSVGEYALVSSEQGLHCGKVAWQRPWQEDMEAALKASLESDKISVIRYPKGTPAEYDREGFIPCGNHLYKDFGESPKTAILTFGRLTAEAVKAAEMLQSKGIPTRVMKLIRVYPLSKKVLTAAAMTYVAATAVALAQLLRLILLFGGRRSKN